MFSRHDPRNHLFYCFKTCSWQNEWTGKSNSLPSAITSVCQELCPGGGLSRHTPGQTLPATAADGTHSTGMHSCIKLIFQSHLWVLHPLHSCVSGTSTRILGVTSECFTHFTVVFQVHWCGTLMQILRVTCECFIHFIVVFGYAGADPQSHLWVLHPLHCCVSGTSTWILRVTCDCFIHSTVVFQVRRCDSWESPVSASSTSLLCSRYAGTEPDYRKDRIKHYIVGELQFSRALRYTTTNINIDKQTNNSSSAGLWHTQQLT